MLHTIYKRARLSYEDNKESMFQQFGSNISQTIAQFFKQNQRKLSTTQAKRNSCHVTKRKISIIIYSF